MEVENPIEHLRECAIRDFEDVSDFVWKALRLIDHERKLEAKKLEIYFADDPLRRAQRKQFEEQKLDETFPYMIATGNMFSVFSLFETYLLLLAEAIQKQSGLKIANIKGQGISKLFSYFRKFGVLPEEISLHEQILAARKIRNCLIHASGVLAWSRDNVDLRRIESNAVYLSEEDRTRRQKISESSVLVNIVESELGERIVVQNMYAYLLSGYMIQYFTILCDKVLGVRSLATN